MNQQVLERDLEVSGKDINLIVDKMLEFNMHGKLTGAGGDGGCVLGFYIKSAELSSECFTDLVKLEEELKQMGYTVHQDITISKGISG